MDDKLQNDIDKDDETPDSAEASGPLGRLLEHSTGSSTAESEAAARTADEPSQPTAVSANYAEGTREHDDDREG